MPAAYIEFSPSEDQMTFGQHFIHLAYFNTLFFAFIQNENGTDDFKTLMSLDGIIDQPDSIDLMNHDVFKEGSPEENKSEILDYVDDTFNYSISSLKKLNDEKLSEGLEKIKVSVFEGHTNFDMILRGEMHTAHHRAQAMGYMRLKNIKPPGFAKFNKW